MIAVGFNLDSQLPPNFRNEIITGTHELYFVSTLSCIDGSNQDLNCLDRRHDSCVLNNKYFIA